MTLPDWLYYDLLGVVRVFTADVFHLWEPWAAAPSNGSAAETCGGSRDDCLRAWGQSRVPRVGA